MEFCNRPFFFLSHNLDFKLCYSYVQYNNPAQLSSLCMVSVVLLSRMLILRSIVTPVIFHNTNYNCVDLGMQIAMQHFKEDAIATWHGTALPALHTVQLMLI